MSEHSRPGREPPDTPLHGTPKQIAYAEAIRTRRYGQLLAEERRLQALDAAHPDVAAEQTRAKLMEAIDRILRVRNAAWWVGTRNMSIRELCSRMMLMRWVDGEAKPQWVAPRGVEELRARWAKQESRERARADRGL